MSKLDLGFWIGLALAIPLSVLANLLTPAAQRWFDRRNQARLARHAGDLREEYELIRSFVRDRSRLNSFLLAAVIRSTLIGSLVGIITGMVFAAASIAYLGGIPNAFGQVLAVIGAIMVVRISSDGLRAWAKVKTSQPTRPRWRVNLGRLWSEASQATAGADRGTIRSLGRSV